MKDEKEEEELTDKGGKAVDKTRKIGGKWKEEISSKYSFYKVMHQCHGLVSETWELSSVITCKA